MAKKQPKTDPTREELINDCKRVQAEFENYRKRVERDQEQFQKRATEALVADCIHILDNLDLVLAHAESDPQGLVEGVRMTRTQLHALLESRGLKEIPTDGAFDPSRHEAIATTTDKEKPTNTIITAHRRGYELGGKVLRPATVTVNKEAGNAQGE